MSNTAALQQEALQNAAETVREQIAARMQVVAEHQAAIAQLQQALAAIEAVAGQAVHGAAADTRSIPTGDPTLAAGQQGPRQKNGRFWLRGKTMLHAAACVLSDAHEPLHIDELISRMKNGGFRGRSGGDFRASLVTQLDRATLTSKNPKGWFLKPVPATYGLRNGQQPEMQLDEATAADGAGSTEGR